MSRNYQGINYNRLNGQFLKGHVPHNKGKKWEEWMDMRKAKKIIRIAKQNLRPNMNLGGWNKKKVVSVSENGTWKLYSSAASAAEATGNFSSNISQCCRGKRKHCGGLRWFYWDSDEWITLIHKD